MRPGASVSPSLCHSKMKWLLGPALLDSGMNERGAQQMLTKCSVAATWENSWGVS